MMPPAQPKVIQALLPGGIMISMPLLRGLMAAFPPPAWRLLYADMRADRLLGLSESHTDGAILYLGSEKDVEVAKRFSFPVVNLGNRLPNPPFPTISHADRDIGKMAAAHLLELPTRSFLVFGTRTHAYSCRRVDGFVSALRAENRPVDIVWFDGAQGKGTGRGGNWLSLTQIQHLVEALPRPVSVFAADQSGLVADAALLAGLRIPQDVRILGVDHNPVTYRYREPRLSYVKMNFEEVGRRAAHSLTRLLAGEEVPPRQEIPSPGIVEHQSTGLLSEGTPQVAAACRFIHARATDAIQVADVVAQAAVCRSLLARQFKEETGMGIGAMIRRERLRAAKRLLIDTDLSLEEIATRCGYADPPRFFEAMRKAEGCTPTAYRKRMGNDLF
ncbi:MAG: substrate-binding domain-containing protein [Verrucomicrobia bacterium]|nr:substrate-binding domain-containing protein [Verrucomicrobiota bacterium]MCH8527317.1 substrate-binding domain-containing protein [Kiritimatiellia bacterium]